MRNELYETSTPEARARSHSKIGKILQELEVKQNGYVISIKANQPIRSISQNKFYWAVVGLYSTHTGYHKDQLDNLFRLDRWFEWKELPSGKSIKIPKKSSDKDVAEFARMCTLFLDWAKEEFPAVIVPRKEDLTYLQWMNLENEYDAAFSG